MTTLHELEERILRLEKQNRELKRARKGLIVEPALNILGQNTRIDGNLYLGGNAVGVWQDWTPTVTYVGGTTDPTSLTITAARYNTIGKMLSFYLTGTLVRGSGDRTYIQIPLPVNYVKNFTPTVSITFAGTKNCVAYGQASNRFDIVLGTPMSTDGYLWVNGFYEIA